MSGYAKEHRRAVGIGLFVLSLALFALRIPTHAQQHSNQQNVDWEALLTKLRYSVFKDTKCLVAVVTLEGSAMSLDLKQQPLTEFLKLRLRNDLSAIPICKKGDKEGLAFVHVHVWTVGDDYPVAFHITLSGGPITRLDAFETAILGYGSKRSIEEQVRKSIRQLVEDFAVAFLKGREEM